MNTKPIPAIIMLTAGLVTCIIGIVQHFSFGMFTKTLFLVLVGFYLLGCIAKLVLDKGFRIMQDPLSDYAGMEIDEELIDDFSLVEEDYLDN